MSFDLSYPLDLSTPCELWPGRLDKNGYAYTGGGNSPRGVSRFVHIRRWCELNGPVPAGLELDHVCRTKSCVNPLHLEAVTHRENMRRAFAAITHCPAGHEYTQENTRIDPRTRKRKCRACHRTWERERRRGAAA